MDKTNILEMCEDTNPSRGCFFLEQWKDRVNWFKMDVPGEGILCIPSVEKLRINYCPSCGAYIREVQIHLPGKQKK